MSSKHLLILDLDNTLYDWVTYYARSFRAMIIQLSKMTGLPEERLISDFKLIHQKYHTSEYSFSIQELPSLRMLHPTSSAQEMIDHYFPAVLAFRQARSKHLQLYPGVKHTLEKLWTNKMKIVGHSDAMSYYAFKRLMQLDIIQYFDCLYAAEEHLIPDYIVEQKESIETLMPDFVIHQLPVFQHKPNPAILQKILSDFKVQADQAVYVGDSLNRDVYMAQQVGVLDVYARYGDSFNREDFALLVKITHWTQEDIKREQTIPADLHPSISIDSFAAVQRIFGVASET